MQLECAVCSKDYTAELPAGTVLPLGLKLVCGLCLADKSCCCVNCGEHVPSYWKYCACCSQAHGKGDGSFEQRHRYHILPKRPKNYNDYDTSDDDVDRPRWGSLTD